MRPLSLLLLLSVIGLVGCDSEDVDDGPQTFTVTLTNVSTPGLIDTDRAMGTVPLSPPAWAVFRNTDPMFVPGQMANLGTERIAEDGFPDEMLAMLMDASNASDFGAETSPGGSSGDDALGMGESVTFTFTAEPGDRLQLETMFVQSNDWFYGFSDGGLDLFDDDDDAIGGDVTSELVVYDAGTEQDTAPGTGPTMPPGGVQKPVQDPMATNVGTAESVAIQPAAQRHPEFTIPPNGSVIRVTISAE